MGDNRFQNDQPVSNPEPAVVLGSPTELPQVQSLHAMESEIQQERFSRYLETNTFTGSDRNKAQPDLSLRLSHFGSENFNNLDVDKDGYLKRSELDLQFDFYRKSDPLAATLMLPNFEVMDNNKDGYLSRSELNDPFKVEMHPIPNTERNITPQEAVRRQATESMVFDRIDEVFPEADRAILKGMSRAIITGDHESLDKMVKTFAGKEADLKGVGKALGVLFSGANLKVDTYQDEGTQRLQFSSGAGIWTESRVTFSVDEAPVSTRPDRSVSEEVDSIAESTSSSRDVMARSYARQDWLSEIRSQNGKAIEGLDTKLTPEQKRTVSDILYGLRTGAPVQLAKPIHDSLTSRGNSPQSMEKVAAALRELTQDSGISFNAFSTPSRQYLQIINSDNNSTLTFDSERRMEAGFTAREPIGRVNPDPIFRAIQKSVTNHLNKQFKQ